jgi:hypothetical protein
MMAAQLIAAHNAAMECYRRAMLGEQTFEGRRENLSQANKLSRTYAALIEVLNRHRGKGQQKVTVEHPLSEAGLLILPSGSIRMRQIFGTAAAPLPTTPGDTRQRALLHRALPACWHDPPLRLDDRSFRQ